jgi:hypothetical protein
MVCSTTYQYDPLGLIIKSITIDSGTIVVTSINASNLQNSSNGLQIFNDHIYATIRPGNSFTVYHAGISDNATGSISSAITPQLPGQIWSVFDLNGVQWGTTQYDGSSPPSYSLYKLQSTTAGLPASSPFISELVGNMPTTFENDLIANMALFARTAQAPTQNQVDRPIPTTNTWGLAGMIAMMGAAAAFMRRRMRSLQDRVDEVVIERMKPASRGPFLHQRSRLQPRLRTSAVESRRRRLSRAHVHGPP